MPARTQIVLENPEPKPCWSEVPDATFPLRNVIMKNGGGMWPQCGTTGSSHWARLLITN
jgi:hypothetical protein